MAVVRFCIRLPPTLPLIFVDFKFGQIAQKYRENKVGAHIFSLAYLLYKTLYLKIKHTKKKHLRHFFPSMEPP